MRIRLRKHTAVGTLHPFVTALFVCFGITWFTLENVEGADATARQEKIDRLVRKWKEMYGPVEFSENRLFGCMVYLHPQPQIAFRDFRNVKLADRLSLEFQSWLREFFKGDFYKMAKPLRPSKYYLNEGRTEPSLLLYELRVEDKSITIIESHNVLLLTIKAESFVAQRGIGGQEVAKLLFDWINLGYTSVDEVVRRFSLPAVVHLGDVFTNRTQPEIGLIRDWKDYIIGFASKDGVNLMLFKAQGFRAAAGFPYDFNWLNKGLYMDDGKTLVAPPSNEGSNDPWGKIRSDQK